MKVISGWISLLAAVLLLGSAASSNAQHGEAPDGYYPPGYMGDTWTGQVSAIDAAKREITLTATTKKGAESFIAYLHENFTVQKNGKGVEVKMTDFSVGQTLRFYYIPKTVKVDGQKVKRNEIIRVESVSSSERR
jgi:hypothetical protein